MQTWWLALMRLPKVTSSLQRMRFKTLTAHLLRILTAQSAFISNVSSRPMTLLTTRSPLTKNSTLLGQSIQELATPRHTMTSVVLSKLFLRAQLIKVIVTHMTLTTMMMVWALTFSKTWLNSSLKKTAPLPHRPPLPWSQLPSSPSTSEDSRTKSARFEASSSGLITVA